MGERIENLTYLRRVLKKAWRIALRRIVFIILFIGFMLLFFCSCAVLKKEKTSEKTSTEKIESKSDSVSKETVNKKIDDAATIKVQQSNTGDRDFDLAVNEAVANVLRSINFQKSSGDNSYRAYYDEKLKAMQFQIELGETKNKETAANNSLVSEKTNEEIVSEYVQKIKGSWITYVLLIILFRKFILGILIAIFPAARGIKTVSDLLTPPNKENI